MASYVTTHAREHVCELPPKNLPCAVVKHCAHLAIKRSICQVHVTPTWNIDGLCRGWRMASYITTHDREQVCELPPKNLPCAVANYCAQLAIKRSICQVHVTPTWHVVGVCRGWRMASYITTHAREQVCELPPKNLPCAIANYCAQLAMKRGICQDSRHAYSARRWALQGLGTGMLYHHTCQRLCM